MIIVALTLGLGNNLFQYSVARRLSLERNTELLFDVSGQNRDRQQFILSYISRFNMAGTVATKKQIMKIKILNRLNFINTDYKNSVFYEDAYEFNPSVINAPKNAYLSGYWQSEKYFDTIKDTIRLDVTLKEPADGRYREILDKIKSSDSVAVHIRRGDYMWDKNLRIFATCTPDYYLRAETLIADKISSPAFYIFSDDIEWVKKNIPFNHPAVFVTDGNLTDCQELMLMRECKHDIIANSTFSWWGAWLNGNPDKIVIAPQKWFTDPGMNAGGLIPSEWIKI